MQFLCASPGGPAPVLPEMLDNEPHVFEVLNAGLRMPEPEALGVPAHQFGGAFDQFRRGR